MQARRKTDDERSLCGLEKRYDAEGEPQRAFSNDLAAINKLRQRGVIDRDHAEMLRNKTILKYNVHESKVGFAKLKAEQNAEAMRHRSRDYTYIVSAYLAIFIFMFSITYSWLIGNGF